MRLTSNQRATCVLLDDLLAVLTNQHTFQCVVANIDADAQPNKEIAGRYGVSSYPTIKFFPRGGKEVESYEGPRTEQAFVDFLNERCGTQRAVGGGLNDKVGHVQTVNETLF